MLTIHPTAAGFLEQAQEALDRDEALHNLMIGVVARLLEQPDYYANQPAYLATWSAGGAPTYAAVMTPPYGLLVAAFTPGAPPAGAVDAVIESLLAGRWPMPSVNGVSAVSGQLARAWSERTGQRVNGEMRERLYALRQVRRPPSPPGLYRKAEAGDISILAEWITAFRAEAIPTDPPLDGVRIATQRLEIFSVWDDGGPVAMMGNNRNTAHLASVGFVYTPPGLRGRGYATALVAAGSQALLDSGRAGCVLFTDLNNPTSNDIYQKIGYEPLADFTMYRFDG